MICLYWAFSFQFIDQMKKPTHSKKTALDFHFAEVLLFFYSSIESTRLATMPCISKRIWTYSIERALIFSVQLIGSLSHTIFFYTFNLYWGLELLLSFSFELNVHIYQNCYYRKIVELLFQRSTKMEKFHSVIQLKEHLEHTEREKRKRKEEKIFTNTIN